MKAIFITFADLGTRKNLKTGDIAPVLDYFESRGEIVQIISRMGRDTRFDNRQNSAVPWLLHAIIGVFGKITSPRHARRVEEKVFDFFASRMLHERGIVFFHPDMCPKTIAKAKKMGSVCVAIPAVADQRFVCKLLESEMKKWGGVVSNDMTDPSSISIMDYVIANSEYSKNTYVQEGFDADHIYCGTFDADFEKFKPGTPDPDYFTVVFPASNTGILKGLQYLLDAWELLDVPNKKLILFGTLSDWPKKAQEKYSHIIENDSTVEKRGLVSSLAGVLAQAHVVVLPSFTEGFSRSIAEAMVCSVPVIVTDRVNDLIVDHKNGLLVPVGESKPVLEALEFLYHNPSQAKELGEKGRETILAKKSFGEDVFIAYQDIKKKYETI